MTFFKVFLAAFLTGTGCALVALLGMHVTVNEVAFFALLGAIAEGFDCVAKKTE